MILTESGFFKEIKNHQCPLTPTDAKYKGSTYNVLVLWEDNSHTWQPLQLMIEGDHVTCSKYAKGHGLLETPGWKPLKRYAKHEKKLKRMLNQTRTNFLRNAPIFKFDIQVPRSKAEAYALDKKNGNTIWADATMRTGLSQLFEYKTFEDKGHIKDVGRHKATHSFAAVMSMMSSMISGARQGWLQVDT